VIMTEITSILFAGVGGQGIVLTSKILSSALIQAGYDVKMSEVHGMAQRGGSVTTQVRFGEKVFSPIIGKGEADILVAFEKIEAMRYVDYLKLKGKLIANDFKIPSAPIFSAKVKYPRGIFADLEGKVYTKRVHAAEAAKELGNMKVQNIIILGVLAKVLGLNNLDWKASIKKEVKPAFFDLNLKAFETGYYM